MDVGEALTVATDSGRTYKASEGRASPGTRSRAACWLRLLKLRFHSQRLLIPRSVSASARSLSPLALSSQLGLIRAFNDAFGTAICEDRALASSDWAASEGLSRAQLEHAALGAFMAWAVGAADGCALFGHAELRTVRVPSPPTQLMLNVCPMLRECEARHRLTPAPVASLRTRLIACKPAV
jgi:hypothetical protein